MTPTIILVHGAFAESASWDGVIEPLRGAGYPVIAAANPLRGLAADAAAVADLVRTVDGPVVLVGHSYGGAVISAAATGNEQVRALVYLSGWTPDEGESITQLFAQKPEGSLVGTAIRPLPFTGSDGTDAGQDLYLDPERFHAAFCADLDRDTSDVMAATQRPWSGTGFAEPSGPPAWKSIPCWYLLCTEDKAIPPATQRFMAERANARIQEAPASHASMVSQPEAATQIILRAAESTAPAMA